jgi:2',3'-cyclic-nucleotide 2'-phosphodiesterase (5'-nucleotidase family)
VLQLEAGQFLYDSLGYPDYVMLQNEQVARAFSQWPVDVINLGRYDLIWARKMLAREGLAERTAALPMLKNLISANGVFEPDVAAPLPFIIKEVTGPRLKGRRSRLRVAFVGLAEPIKPSGGAYDGTVKNMFETGRQAVLAARKKSDVLVVVAHSEFETALRLANENPEADVVIAGNAATVYNVRKVGKTTVVCAAPGNTEQGDLRLYLAPDGSFSFKFRSIPLDASVPSDPAAEAFTEAARKEYSKFRER